MIRARRETLGEHALIRGDCLSVMRRMPIGSVDVVVTSPPYNLGLAYRSYKDSLSEESYLDWMELICQKIARVLKADGS
ncbi:MAG: site-specific DNA-methyltransferase, partial [Bombella apis]|nr:site-specific DNA-methyltransferase [Bombella apis]